MTLPPSDAHNPSPPTSEEIYEMVDRTTNWIPRTKLFQKKYGRLKSFLLVHPEEVDFIHPLELCLLRIKHELALLGVAREPGDAFVKVEWKALKAIDEKFPGIVNPTGGFGAKFWHAYKDNSEFTNMAKFHIRAVEVVTAIEAEGPYDKVWVGSIPFFAADKSYIKPKQIKEALAKGAGVELEKIARIQLNPSSWEGGIHGGSCIAHITQDGTAKKIIEASSAGKISIDAGIGAGTKKFNMVVKPYLETPGYNPPQNTAAAEDDDIC